MQNKYPLWKNALLILIAIVGLIYALPNVYGEDPALQISPNQSAAEVTQAQGDKMKAVLKDAGITIKSFKLHDRSASIRFVAPGDQLKARDLIKTVLGTDYTVAANLLPATPQWLRAIGAEPMKYGLDLRGGVHFLLEVDVDGVIAQRVQGVMKSASQELRQAHLRYASMRQLKDNAILIGFREVNARDAAYELLRKNFPNLLISKKTKGNQFNLHAHLTPQAMSIIRQSTLEQTSSILRNRVNELGIGEAVVQRQGADRIAVDLPGIQDAARAKKILGGTETLQFHLVDSANDANVASRGVVPVGSKLVTYHGRPILLKSQVILSGESIVSALSTYDDRSGTPAVAIQLGSGSTLFSRVTRENIGKSMAIIFVKTKQIQKKVDGKIVRVPQRIERVISVATIRDALGNNFQITGLDDPNEARNLALFLRAGALPATIYPVEERLIGPSLGAENIHRGLVSLEIGMGIILLVMVLYYRLFGLIANIALLLNLVLLVAVLSLLGATLTLPGIAGIVLTVGMAVDANVLIYERIREELRHGITPQAAIFAGYERAFATIVDANVTTLIVVIVLYAIGSGAIQGFAITTSIGILTSMLTAVVFSRAIVNFFYGCRQVKHLSIGTVATRDTAKTQV